MIKRIIPMLLCMLALLLPAAALGEQTEENT